MRSAIDIRNIDVAAASKAGVLVTHAEAGFVKSVVELTLGFLVDLSRGVRAPATQYHRGEKPEIRVGRQLRQHRRHHRLRPHLARSRAGAGGARHDGDGERPLRPDRRPALRQAAAGRDAGRADYVICLAIANEETENLMNEAMFARMKPDAFFINMSRGNLVDEAALAKSLTEAASPAPPWMSAARPTRCRRRAGPVAQRHRHAAYRRADAAGQ